MPNLFTDPILEELEDAQRNWLETSFKKLKQFLTQKTVNFWDLLPQESMDVDSISQLKRELNNFTENKYMISGRTG